MIYAGYYLVELNLEDMITSYDGSHSKPKSVSLAKELWSNLHFIKKNHTYKMIKIKQNVDTTTSEKDYFNALLDKGELELKEIKDPTKYKKKHKINNEAINILNNIRGLS